jgi:hypothetical protein
MTKTGNNFKNHSAILQDLMIINKQNTKITNSSYYKM